MTKEQIDTLKSVIEKCIEGCINNKMEFGMTNLEYKNRETYSEIVNSSLELYNPKNKDDFINTIYAVMGETNDIHQMIGKMKIKFQRIGDFMVLHGEKIN